MRSICVRDAPWWDSNVLNASSTNCNCERVFASGAKLQLAVRVCGLERRMRIQNSFPGSQMFVRARNKKSLQRMGSLLQKWRFTVRRFTPFRLFRRVRSVHVSHPSFFNWCHFVYPTIDPVRKAFRPGNVSAYLENFSNKLKTLDRPRFWRCGVRFRSIFKAYVH